jgi:phytoene desaturase
VRSAVVAGAGLGGLATGIHLARQGWRVTVLERNSRPGGRMSRLDEQGFQIDMGPTLLMMPEVLSGIFHSCGRRVEDYLELRRLEPAYEVRFADGARVTMGTEPITRESFRRLSPADADALPRLLADMERKYRVGRFRFIERQFNGLGDLLHPTTLGGLARSLPVQSVWRYVARHIRDERLRQALTFQTLYLGTSPYRCPSIYGFLPFIEMRFGVWFPRGGMYAIAAALERLFGELGGTLETGAEVREIEVRHGTARGVRLADGRLLEADAVVSNCDVQTTYSRLLPPGPRRVHTPQRIAARESGCSGYLLYLGVRRVPADWRHHTVLLPPDYPGVMEDLFTRGVLPRHPALYACVPTLSDPTLAPAGHHVLYLLAPVPHLGGRVNWEAEGPAFRRRCLDAVRAAGWEGLEEDVVLERQFTPPDFQRRYGLYRGSAFGLAHTFFQSAYFRPHNRSEEVRGLYLVGASTHPGGGVPIVLTSARLVAETMEQDWARHAAARFRPARAGIREVAGGTS